MRDKKTSVWPSAVALAVALALLPHFTAVAAAAEEAGDGWHFLWKDSFRLDSPDGSFRLQFGGRLQFDWTFPNADDAIEDAFGPLEEANEVRRARLFVQGTLYENVEFKAEYDFAGGSATFDDLYVGLVKTPVGGIRLGHFKEPFSLDRLTGGNYLPFLERSLTDVFAPARNVGIMLHNHRGDRLTWALGAFRESDDVAISEGSGKLNITGRITGLPVYRDQGRRLLHLGLSLSRKDLGGEPFRYRQRPEIHQGPRLVDTGSFSAQEVNLWDFELAVVAGSFWAHGEVMGVEADAAPLGDPSFGGWFIQGGWFLTGEHRAYRTSAAAFDRQSPNKNFGQDGGRGAWEIALRYSTLDLSDAGIDGGEVDDFTVALNWYLNPASRLMMDYVRSDRDGVGKSGFVLLRFQVVF